ncbi:MAG TPA: hypothetical protein VIT38_08780 [Allosphingosinicella sp.]
MTMHSKEEMNRRDAFITPDARKQQIEVHRTVGLYIIVWSTVESLLIGLLGHLLNTSKANTQIIYTGLRSVRQRRGTIEALIKHNMANDALRKRLLSALQAFKTSTALRNKLAHGQFGFNDQGFYVSVYYYDLEDAELDNATATSEPINQKWIDKIGDELRRLSFLEEEFGKITDAWLVRHPQKRQATRP